MTVIIAGMIVGIILILIGIVKEKKKLMYGEGSNVDRRAAAI